MWQASLCNNYFTRAHWMWGVKTSKSASREWVGYNYLISNKQQTSYVFQVFLFSILQRWSYYFHNLLIILRKCLITESRNKHLSNIKTIVTKRSKKRESMLSRKRLTRRFTQSPKVPPLDRQCSSNLHDIKVKIIS